MATTAPDMTTFFKDIIAAFPVDTKFYQDAFDNSAEMNEKMIKVALQTAQQSADISSKWTKDTLGKISTISTVKTDPADYAKALTDFASAQAEVAAENIAAFAEVAKKAQMETVQLVMAAGKEATQEATDVVKKATKEVNAVAKKAAGQ
ncbi:MAG: phasin family protein [Paracoccaceae bacterium]